MIMLNLVHRGFELCERDIGSDNKQVNPGSGLYKVYDHRFSWNLEPLIPWDSSGEQANKRKKP